MNSCCDTFLILSGCKHSLALIQSERLIGNALLKVDHQQKLDRQLFSILSHVLWYLKIDAFLFSKDFDFLILENETVLFLPVLLSKEALNPFDKKNDYQYVS